MRCRSGQTSTELMLLISVVVVAVVAAAYAFVPRFREGTEALGGRVKQALSTGNLADLGVGGGNGGGKPDRLTSRPRFDDMGDSGVTGGEIDKRVDKRVKPPEKLKNQHKLE